MPTRVTCGQTLRHQYWQWIAERQWQAGRTAARSSGVAVFGDLPFVANLQSPEVWEQYKRTCYPNLTLVNDATSIPVRFIYGADERSTNSNVPAPSVAGKRNPVNPLVTTSADGTACRGQR